MINEYIQDDLKDDQKDGQQPVIDLRELEKQNSVSLDLRELEKQNAGQPNVNTERPKKSKVRNVTVQTKAPQTVMPDFINERNSLEESIKKSSIVKAQTGEGADPNFQRIQLITEQRKRFNKERQDANLTGKRKQELEIYDSLQQETIKNATKFKDLPEERRKLFNEVDGKPQEGIVKTNDVTMLERAGVNSSSVTPTQTQSGDISPTGRYVVKLSKYRDLHGGDYRKAVVRDVLGNLTNDDNVKNLVMNYLTNTEGDNLYVNYYKDGNIPLEDVGHSVEIAETAITDDGEVFGIYEDAKPDNPDSRKQATLPQLVALAELVNKKGESSEMLADYLKAVGDVFAPEDAEMDKFFEDRKAESRGKERTDLHLSGVLGEYLGIQITKESIQDISRLFIDQLDAFAESTGSYIPKSGDAEKFSKSGKSPEGYSYVFAGTKKERLARALGIIDEEATELAYPDQDGQMVKRVLIPKDFAPQLSKLSAIQSYKNSTRLNNAIQTFDQSKYSSKIISNTLSTIIKDNPVSAYVLKQAGVDVGKLDLKFSDSRVGLNAVQLGLAMTPVVGLPTLALSLLGARDKMPVEQGNNLLALSALTLGASRGLSSNLVTSIIGKGTASGLQLVNTFGGAFGITYINMDAYKVKNPDGTYSFKVGEMLVDNAGDIFQLTGKDIPETYRGIKGGLKNTFKPEFVNMFLRNEDTGEVFGYYRDAHTDELRLKRLPEDAVKKYIEKNPNEPMIFQTLNNDGINLVKKADPKFQENFVGLISGKKPSEMVSFDGKKAKVLEDKVEPLTQDRSWYLLDILGQESPAKINVKEGLVGDADLWANIKKMTDDGIISQKDNGELAITEKGRGIYEQQRIAIEEARQKAQEIQKIVGRTVEDDFIDKVLARQTEMVKEESKKVTDKVEKSNLPPDIEVNRVAGELKGNKYALKYLRKDIKEPIRITPSDLSGMSEQERTAVIYGLGLGALEMDGDIITNKEYSYSQNNQSLRFGKDDTGYENRYWFMLGEEMDKKGGNKDRIDALVTDLKRVTGLDEKQIKTQAIENYKQFQEQIKTSKGEDVVSLSLLPEAPEPTVKIPETRPDAQAEAPTEKPADKIQENIQKKSGFLHRLYKSDVAEERIIQKIPVGLLEFNKYKEGESLPERLMVHDTETGKRPLYTKISDNLYRDFKGSTITESNLKGLLASDRYEFADVRPSKELNIKANYALLPKDHNFKLPDEVDRTSRESYEKGTGEVNLTKNLKVNIDDGWERVSPAKFVQDGDTFFVNDRALHAIRDLLGYRGELPDGLAEPKRVLEFAFNRLDSLDHSPEEKASLEALKQSIKSSDSKAISLIRVNKDAVSYDKFSTNKVHEEVHKELIKATGSKVLFSDEDLVEAPFKTQYGFNFIQAVKKSLYKGIATAEGGNPNYHALSHEVLAMSTNAETVRDFFGVDTSEKMNDYLNVYADVLDNIAKNLGDNVAESVVKYQDPRLQKLLKQYAENRNYIRTDELETGGRGLEGSQRAGQRGSDSQSPREIKSEWRGSGVKRVRGLRLTPDGNPFSLTGKNGAEHLSRLRDKAKNTFNFFVSKPDGTYVIEPEFRNYKGIPFEMDADFNLLDLGTDVEAWDFYKNNPFPKFQEWAESRGFDGFFSGRDDLPDYIKYRVAVFDNETTRAKISGNQELPVKSEVSELGFYSSISEALTSPKVPLKATGKQYLDILKSSISVKKDELEWSGVDVFLGGKDKVTLEEVNNFLEEGKVTVTETRRSKESGKSPKFASQGLVTDGTRGLDVELLLQIPRLEKGNTADIDKFEPLTQLPDNFRVITEAGWYDKDKTVYHIKNEKGHTYGSSESKDDAIRVALKNYNYENKQQKTTEQFVNKEHYLEPNIIAHIRGNERIFGGYKNVVNISDRNPVRSKRAFHVEEFQSDLHAKGYDKGYKSEILARNKELVEQKNQLIKELDELSAKKDPTQEEIDRSYKLDNDITEIAGEIRKLQPESAVPDAPFKDTWQELAFKRALRYAVEKGYDRLTWTTGKQQIDRYSNLIRQNVDTIEYQKYEDGVVEVNALKNGGQVFSEKINLEGTTEIEGKNYTLENVLGNSIAKQIRENPENIGQIEGDNLSIGGQYHKYLYDEKIPKFASKYIKKWGASVGEAEIDTGTQLVARYGDLLSKEPLGDYQKKALEEYVKDSNYIVRGSNFGDSSKKVNSVPDISKYSEFEVLLKKKEKVHSIDVTPQMKESILEGQPLFMMSDESLASKQNTYVNRQEDTESVRRDRRMRDNYLTAPHKQEVKRIDEIVKNGFFSTISPIKDGMTEAEKFKALESMRKDLDSMNYFYVEGDGVYKGESEPSFTIYYPDSQTSRIIQYLGNKYGQESVLHGKAGQYFLETADGQVFSGSNLKTQKTSTESFGTKLQDNYAKSIGKEINSVNRPYLKLPEDSFFKSLSKEHQELQNQDTPEARKSYQSLIKETSDQYKSIRESGIKIEAWEGEGEPYKGSREMLEDIRNNHYYYLKTDEAYGSGGVNTNDAMLNPSGLKDSKGRNLPNNDVFRIVHDLMGHTGNKYQFGIRGEWNAFVAHSELYSKDALPALISETLMQNSVVADKNYTREGSSYKLAVEPDKIKFADQKAVIPSPETVSKVVSEIDKQNQAEKPVKDGTYLKLPDGNLKFNLDIDWENPQQIDRDLSLAELKFKERQKNKTTVLTLDEINRAYTESVFYDAQGNKIESNAVFDREGLPVGKAEVDEKGRVFLNWDNPKKNAEKPVYLIDGVGSKGKDKFYVGKTRRDIIASIGFFQQLVKLTNPDIEFPVRPEKKGNKNYDKEMEAFNIKRSEIVLNHIDHTLRQWENTDPSDFGAMWYSEESNNFAKSVGRNVKDVNNDVVKLWLFLMTASTSPNNTVPINANFATNALATMVRFYESGKLDIPIFQRDNQGNIKLAEYSGKPAQYGLGSAQLEKTKLLSEGYVPFASEEGKALVKLGAEVKTGKELLGESVAPRNKYVFSDTAKAMMDKHGALQGVMNYLLSPSVGTKPNKAVDIYGDKLGVFFSNLIGITQIPTIDTWMNRYFMGLTGEGITVERTTTGTIKKIQDNSANFDVSEGDFFRGLIQKGTEEWNKKSDNKLTPADTQAILWTQIKDLFNSFVTTEESNIDYATAYKQMEERAKREGKEMSKADTNPQLLKDAENKAPLVKRLTETDYGKYAHERFYIENRNGLELSMKSDEGFDKKQADIDLSDPDLTNADYESWVNVASNLVKGGHLADSELNRIKALSDKKDVEGLNKYVLSLNKMNPLELLVNLGRVSLLLGVKNTVKNAFGNSLRQFMDEVSRVPASVLDLAFVQVNKALGADNFERSTTSILTNPVNTLRAYKEAFSKGLPEGAKESWETLLGRTDEVNFEHPALFRERTTGWKLLRPLEIVERFGWRYVASLDKTFGAVAYHKTLSELQGMRLNEERKAGNNITYEDAGNYLTIMDYQLAEDYAIRAIYQEKNRLAGKYYATIEGLPPTWRAIANNIVKFVKTPLNVVDYVMDYTGFWQLAKLAYDKHKTPDWTGWKQGVKDILNNPQDRKTLSMAISQGAIGTLMYHIGFRLAEAGIISGFYDEKDKKEREEQQAKGTSYGSVNIAGRSVDISWLSPNAFYLLAGGSMYKSQSQAEKKVAEAQAQLNPALESGDENKIKTSQDKLNKAKSTTPNEIGLSRIIKNLALQTPFLRQIDDIESSISQGKLITGLTEKWVTPESYVPAIVKEIAGTKDTTDRLVRNDSLLGKMSDKVQQNIPTLPIVKDMGKKLEDTGITGLVGAGKIIQGREALPKEYDMLGREIETNYGIDPFKVTKIKDDNVLKELDKFNITVPSPRDGTSEQRNEERHKKGQYYEENYKAIIESDTYKKLKDSGRERTLRDVSSILSEEFREDKLKPEEEKYNMNVVAKRELFRQELVDSPRKFSTNRTITDKEIVRDIVKSGVKGDISLTSVLNDIKDLDKFLSKNFRFNLSVNKKNTKEEAERKLKEFESDPEKTLIGWWASQKEYEERSARLKARREELIKQGKSKEEIDKQIRKESARLGASNRKKYAKIKSINIIRDKTFDNFDSQRKSDNVVDNR